MTQPGNHIGTIIKPHGYKGELLLRGKQKNLENLKIGMPLFIEIDEQSIPFFIEEFSTDALGEKMILKLEFIDSDIEARRYINCEVFGELFRSDKIPGITSPNDFIGFIVKDKDSNAEFEVIDFYDNAENPILVLKDGGKQLLLPRNADYVLEIDNRNKTIIVDLPDGIFL
jgi:16S rRNA processing protein RimM